MKRGTLGALLVPCLALIVLLVITVPAQADPWVSYLDHTDTVDYVEVVSTMVGGLWYYYMTIDLDAIDPTFGNVIGVKGLAVYLAEGYPVPTSEIPADWNGFETSFTRAGWDYNGFYEEHKGAFGYITASPTNYVPDDGSQYLIGAADFPDGFDPSDQVYLVHIASETGGTVNTYWARPGNGHIVPEPSTLLALAGIGIPAVGFFVRRRRNS